MFSFFRCSAAVSNVRKKDLNAICVVAYHLNTNSLYKTTWAMLLASALIPLHTIPHRHDVCVCVLSKCVLKSWADHAYFYNAIAFLCALQESERNRRKKRMSSDLYEFAHASCRHSIFDSLRCGRVRLQRGFFHVEHSTTHSQRFEEGYAAHQDPRERWNVYIHAPFLR